VASGTSRPLSLTERPWSKIKTSTNNTSSTSSINSKVEATSYFHNGVKIPHEELRKSGSLGQAYARIEALQSRVLATELRAANE
jgi:hypothetical protein